MFYKIVPSLNKKYIVKDGEKLYYIKRAQSERLIGVNEFKKIKLPTKRNWAPARGLGQRARYVENKSVKILMLSPVAFNDIFHTDSPAIAQRVQNFVQIFEVVRVLTVDEFKEKTMLQ